jgi:hypothetical protein
LQNEQIVAPASENAPAVHAVHVAAVGVAAIVPAPHLTHVVNGAVEIEPEAQGRHYT